jgi:heme A synthase
MSRVFLEYLLPLLLPSGAFVAYVVITRKTNAADMEQRLREGPWFWLIISGFVLAVAVLFVTGLTEGYDADSTYTPSRMENGRFVPGEFK